MLEYRSIGILASDKYMPNFLFFKRITPPAIEIIEAMNCGIA